jgi:hypothetical protein
MDIILKSTLRRQVPFLIGGTITSTIMTYFYGFPFTIVVNSAIWYGTSYVVNKVYWKSKDLMTKNTLSNIYALSKINSRRVSKISPTINIQNAHMPSISQMLSEITLQFSILLIAPSSAGVTGLDSYPNTMDSYKKELGYSCLFIYLFI